MQYLQQETMIWNNRVLVLVVFICESGIGVWLRAKPDT